MLVARWKEGLAKGPFQKCFRHIVHTEGNDNDTGNNNDNDNDSGNGNDNGNDDKGNGNNHNNNTKNNADDGAHKIAVNGFFPASTIATRSSADRCYLSINGRVAYVPELTAAIRGACPHSQHKGRHPW